ncbi:MAG TPA: alpha/beta hydrolase [Syntrophomonadaceae bacterium]|nr:alpha/beta hydrolase [Syntrophomonadaceae bacterium]
MSDFKGLIEINNTKLFFRVKGEGEPVVFIHGMFNDHRVWEYQIDVFASRYKVICLDQRGYGKSDLPIGPFSHLEDIRALMDAFSLTKASIIGSSRGGAVATEFALKYPEMVKNLVLVGSDLKGFPYPPDHIQQIMNLFMIMQSAGLEAGINDYIANPYWAYCYPSPNRPEARDKVIQIVRESMNAFRWVPTWDVELTPSAFESVEKIELPVLLIMGEKDHELNQQIEDYLHGKIKNSKKIVMEDCCHFPFVEKPEEFNQIVLEFLQGVVK